MKYRRELRLANSEHGEMIQKLYLCKNDLRTKTHHNRKNDKIRKIGSMLNVTSTKMG